MIHGRLLNSLRALAMVGLVLAAGIAQAQNAIESLNVSQQGATVILKINLKNEPGNPPAGFLVANPPRVALDFPNTVNALGRNSQEVGQGELRSLSVVQVGDRSRVVLNLKSAVTYDTKVEGKSILVTLNGATAAGGPPPAAAGTFAEAKPSDGRSALRDIDFRRAADGSGRIVVELANRNTGVDIRQQGQTLVVDFQKSQLPDNLRRRLDVGDFATPVLRSSCPWRPKCSSTVGGSQRSSAWDASSAGRRPISTSWPAKRRAGFRRSRSKPGFRSSSACWPPKTNNKPATASGAATATPANPLPTPPPK